MKGKPQSALLQKKRSRKQATQYPPPSSQPPTRIFSLAALETNARNVRYYKPDVSYPPILSRHTKSRYPVRSASFPSQPPLQATYKFSSPTPQTAQIQSLLSVLSPAQNRNMVLSVPSLIDASKFTPTTISSVGSVPDSKGAENAFATALKSLLLVASVASTSTNSTPVVNQPAALLAPPNKLEDTPSPSSSGEGDTNTPKPSAGSIAEDLSSTTYISPEVRRIEKGKVVLDENVHPNEPSTPSKSEKKCDGEKVPSSHLSLSPSGWLQYYDLPHTSDRHGFKPPTEVDDQRRTSRRRERPCPEQSQAA